MKESIIVQNLKCGGCAHTITTKLSKLEGVSNVQVVVEKSEVQVEFTPENLSTPLNKVLSDIGYPPEGEKNSLVTKAKSVVSCATGKLGSE